MPVHVSDYLADTFHLGTEQHSADLLLPFHFLPLQILDGYDVTGSAPNAWNSGALLADSFEIPAGHWLIGHTRRERTRIAANSQSNPNKARLAARGPRQLHQDHRSHGTLSMPACVPTVQQVLHDALSCLAMPPRSHKQGQRYRQPSILPAPPKGWNDSAGDASSQSSERLKARGFVATGGYAESARTAST
jgi:hypothetical protein